MQTKKSQITNLETVVVIAAFFFTAILALAFYSNIFQSNIAKNKDDISALNSISSSQKILSLQEIKCSKEIANAGACVDIIKFESSSKIVNTPEFSSYYFNEFGFSRITLREIYPDAKEIAVFYDKHLDSYSRKSMINVPVSIFYPIENRKNFGIITIETFLR